MLENNLQQIKHLLVIEDLRGKRSIPLESNTCSIGRHSNNSIMLHSQLASRQHAILLRVTSPETASYLFRIIDGNLQGKRSTNGITVNGQRCFSHDLKHGDLIVFGEDVKASYYACSNLENFKLLTSCQAEYISNFLPQIIDPFETQIYPRTGDENTSESALVRLASFPELLVNPIVEISLEGKITYLNPAAIQQFPDIRETQLQHPILADLLSLVQNERKKFFSREVEYKQLIFEQSIHYIAESDLIRSYIIDITEHKRIELALQQEQHALEVRVSQHTDELSKANEQLRNEILERQRTQEALHSSFATNRALLNAMPDSMFRISKEGIFVNFKAAKDNNFPMLRSEFLGRSLFDILPTEIAQQVMNCLERALQTGEVQILECQMLVKENLRDYELRIVTSAENNEVIAIVREITERKQAEAEIYNALQKEKELNELKSRFVTMASHEFRTPLSIILSSAELLEYCSNKLSEEKKLNHLQRIQAAVKQMTGLLNDVLLLSKAEAGKLEFKPLPLELVQFCQNIVEEIQLTTSSHQIIFCCNKIYINVCMDEKLLRIIFNNLLSNAIKYSSSGTFVNFDLNCEQEIVVFQIKDRGMGIPIIDQNKLFDSFFRASNVGNISGTGLGLAIVKRAVDLQKGKITFESEAEVGTTFTITIPLTNEV